MYWAQKKGINIYFFWLEYAHMYSIHFIVVKAWLESPPLLDFWAFGCVNITFHNLIFFFFFYFFGTNFVLFSQWHWEPSAGIPLCCFIFRQTNVHTYIYFSLDSAFGPLFLPFRFHFLHGHKIYLFNLVSCVADIYCTLFFFFGDVGVLFSCFCLFNLCVIFSCKDGKLWVSNLSKWNAAVVEFIFDGMNVSRNGYFLMIPVDVIPYLQVIFSSPLVIVKKSKA